MTHFRLILSAVLFSVFSMFSQLSFAETPIYSSNNIALQGYDVVAFHTENKARLGSLEFSYQWQGVDWHFSSQKHKELFIESPSSYSPLFGGFCGLGAAHGALVPADPEVWTIHKGQLVLNQDKEVSKTWRYNPDKNIQRAKQSYEKAISRYKKWQSKANAQTTPANSSDKGKSK